MSTAQHTPGPRPVYDVNTIAMGHFVVRRCDGKLALELITRHPIRPFQFVKYLPANATGSAA